MAKVNSYMDVAQYSNPNVSILNPTGKVKPIGAVGKSVDNLANSPAANAAGYIGRNVAAAAALPVTAISDAAGIGLNAANRFLGGSDQLFNTNATDSTINFAKTGNYAPTAETIAPIGSAAVTKPMPVRSPAQVTAAANAAAGKPQAVTANAPAIAAPAANSFPTLKSIGGVDPNGPEVMDNLIKQRDGVYVPQQTTFANNVQPIAANPGGKTLFTDTGGYMEGGTAREPGNKAAENLATTGNIHGTVEVPILDGQGRSVGNRSEIASPINAPAIFKNKQELAKDATDRRGQDILADTTIQARTIDAIGREATAKAKAIGDGQAESGKEYGKRVEWHLNNIKDRRLPAGFENKHAELAADLAANDDPSKDVGIYYAPGQANRMGIVTKKSVFEGMKNKYLQSGYSELDAYSHAVRDLKTEGDKRRTKLYKDIPNLEGLYERDKKPAEISGVL